MDSKRNEIVRAAIKLFAQKGFAGASVRDIAREVGLSEAALYKHFPSKDAMATAVVLQYTQFYIRVIDHWAGLPGPFGDRLDGLITETLRLHDEDPHGALLLQQRYRVLSETPVPMRTPLEAFREMLDAAVASGEIPPQETLLSAALVLGALQRLAAFADNGRFTGPLAELAGGVTHRMRALLGVL